MSYYKYIDFYPQDIGMSFEMSFQNYDNNWTGCLDFISSGVDKLKLNFNSGKIYDNDNNFLFSTNIKNAGENINNVNLISGNIFPNHFNLYSNNNKVFSSQKNKNYGAFSGLSIYSNNLFWQSNGVNLKLGAKTIPRYYIVYSGSGFYKSPYIPIGISGVTTNRYPFKVNLITLGTSEQNPSPDVIPHLFISGINISYNNPLLVPPNEVFYFNLAKVNTSTFLEGAIPMLLSTNFGRYQNTLFYTDVKRTRFEQSSVKLVNLRYQEPSVGLAENFHKLIGNVYLQVYNSDDLFSGISVFVSGLDGNNVCDYTLCDSFFPNWSFSINGLEALWLYKQTDLTMLGNIFPLITQLKDNVVDSFLYTGGYTGGEYVSNLKISKNIYAPQEAPAFNTITGFGVVLYNQDISTGANINIEIYNSNHWSGTTGYNSGTGIITPNINKLIYSESFSINLSTEPQYFPINLSGSVNLSGKEYYSIVFSAYTNSGIISWPKSYYINQPSGLPYSSALGYEYTGTQISYETGYVSNLYNSYISTPYNHAFEINPKSSLPNTMYQTFSGGQNISNQFFDIEITKKFQNRDFTGSAGYLISGHNIMYTGLVGVSNDIFRQIYGLYS